MLFRSGAGGDRRLEHALRTTAAPGHAAQGPAVTGQQHLEVVGDLVAVVGERLGWDEHRRAGEVEGYRTWLDHLAIPDQGGPRSSSFGAEAVEAPGGPR